MIVHVGKKTRDLSVCAESWPQLKTSNKFYYITKCKKHQAIGIRIFEVVQKIVRFKYFRTMYVGTMKYGRFAVVCKIQSLELGIVNVARRNHRKP